MADKMEISSSFKRADLLPFYYKKLFPHDQIYKWLSYGGNDNYLSRREFSVTSDQIYCRFLSFGSLEAMRKEIVRRCPDRMDLGAVYNTLPTNGKVVEHFVALERELVFDVDLDDFDEVLLEREKGKSLTRVTWFLMATAVKVLNDVLRTEFGFKHILFVYSGRRGVHCWVCDKRARLLSNQARSSIISFLQIFVASKTSPNLHAPYHPTFNRLHDKYLEPIFLNVILKEHNLFSHPEHTKKLLELIPESKTKENIKAHLESLPIEEIDSVKVWNDLKTTLMKSGLSYPQCILQNIVLLFTYPRLDINVSKLMNHLLKIPFAIHPSTGRVCVPIDVGSVSDFDPDRVPTLEGLFKEWNDNGGNGETALRESVQLFEDFVRVLPSERFNSTSTKPQSIDQLF